MKCRYCGAALAPERAAIYDHCTARRCVAQWRRERIEDAGLSLVLVPKQGMAWVSTTDAATNTKSSGKS